MVWIMSAVKTEPASDFGRSPPGPRARRFRMWKIAGGAVVLLIVLAGGLTVERKPIAAFLVRDYLLRHGVVATVEFDRLARGGFAARVRTPEFSAEVVDVTLTYGGPFAIPALGAVRLVRPVLHARFDGTRLSF